MFEVQNKKAKLMWQECIKDYENSCQTQYEYCCQNSIGIALSTFGYWKRKLKRNVIESPPRFYPLALPVTPPNKIEKQVTR